MFLYFKASKTHPGSFAAASNFQGPYQDEEA